MVNTVSHGYADEIKSPYGGSGIAPYLSDKGDDFYGILNGVDYNDWSPEKDRLIPANYSIDDMAGKAACKRELQRRFLLEEDGHIAVIGIVGRFVEQKGYHLLAEIISGILSNMHVQIVILGSGDNGLEHYFGNLPKSFPGKVGAFIGFNNELAHLIEAGSDFFLMPSIYEPCGLNQLYSLKYGTIPIVRATGGLNDTVHNYDEASGEGTGFKFWEASARALYYAVGWAMSTYYDRPDHMEKMIREAMSQDYSWEKSALEYELLYERAIDNKKSYDRLFV
jgi:starch synthase